MTSNIVSVGVAGTSWWADAMHLPALASHPQARTIAICGRNRANAQKMAERWDIPQVYTDYREMIDDADLDAVVISTPNSSHYPISMRALDKRLACALRESRSRSPTRRRGKWRKRQRRAGSRRCAPFTYSFMPTARYLKELIDDGYLGSPYHLNMRYYTGFARDGDYRWRFDRKIAGSGSRWRSGLALSVSSPSGSLAQSAPSPAGWGFSVPRPPVDPAGEPYEVVDDSCMLTLEFASGALGMIHCTALCYEDTPFGQTHHMEFHGSDGTLYSFTDWDKIQQVKGARVGEGMVRELPIPDHIWGNARRDTVHNTYRDMFRSEDFMIRGFINGILNDVELTPSFREGAEIQRLLSAALRSHETERRVEVASITA